MDFLGNCWERSYHGVQVAAQTSPSPTESDLTEPLLMLIHIAPPLTVVLIPVPPPKRPVLDGEGSASHPFPPKTMLDPVVLLVLPYDIVNLGTVGYSRCSKYLDLFCDEAV